MTKLYGYIANNSLDNRCFAKPEVQSQQK